LNLNKIPTGFKIIACMTLSMAAFVTRTMESLSILLCINILITYLFQASYVAIIKTCRFYATQTVIILILYIFRFGFETGIKSGSIVSFQFVLFLLPGSILTNSISPSQTAKSLSKLLPHHLAFVLAICLHFIHYLIEEIKEIYEAQLMRGAKISPKELLIPGNWKDVIYCLLIPIIVHGIVMAKQISLAAKVRGFKINSNRSYWNGLH